MRITKEDLNKLTQGDRIEFLLKSHIVDNFNSCILFLGLSLICSCFGILMMTLSKKTFSIGIFSALGSLAFIIIFWVFLTDSVKKMRNIQEEYFKVEVKEIKFNE